MNQLQESIRRLQQWLDESENVVFFGGAGVSTESGVPDFRSVDGLYHQKYREPPETILSHTYFMQKPEGFFRFYRDKMLPLGAQPNDAHKKLAELERAGKLRAVITQNIDGLHQKAGSREVLELHGSVLRNHCMRCGKFYGVEAVAGGEGLFNLALAGKGIVCLESQSPKEELIEVTLENDVLKIDGSMAVAWSGSLDFTVERSGKSLLGSAVSGEGLVNVFRGTGRVLLAPVDKV